MSRRIRRRQGSSSTEIARLLQSLFAAEFLNPSRTIWLVSPWISDIEIIDNSAGDFDSLGDWGPRGVRFSEVLTGLVARGTKVVVATTSADSNASFLRNLELRTRDLGLNDRLAMHAEESMLHEKALTTDTSLIWGSMNFTFNGVFIRGEMIEFTTDPERVAEARLDNYDRFGGVL